MNNGLAYFTIRDYPKISGDDFKVKVIATPEAFITFRKEPVFRNKNQGSSIYYATDEFQRDYIVKEFRLFGSKEESKNLSRSSLNSRREKSYANIQEDARRLLLLGRPFGPYLYCQNRKYANKSTKAYAVQSLMGANLQSVNSFLRNEGHAAHPIALFVARDLVKDLATIHRKGIIHMDVKPENVCLSAGRFIFIDFDISADGPDGQTRGNTAEYAPPEQLVGHFVSEKVDIFSLGILLGELFQEPGFRLLGRQSFEKGEQTFYVNLEYKHYRSYLNKSPNLDPDISAHFDMFFENISSVSPDFVALIETMTNPEPEGRPDAKDIQAILKKSAFRLPPVHNRAIRKSISQMPLYEEKFDVSRSKLLAAIEATRPGYPNFWKRA